MAFIIEYFDSTTALNLYALLFNSSNQSFNPSTQAFTAYLDSQITNFNLNLTENVNRAKYYSYTVNPSGFPAGTYNVEIYRKVGGSPSKISDILKGIGTIQWNGSGMMDEVVEPRLDDAGSIGDLVLGSTLGFHIMSYDKFGNLVNPDQVEYAVYQNSTLIGVTGILSNLETGLSYGEFMLTSGTFAYDKDYTIRVKGYIKGTRVGTIIPIKVSSVAAIAVSGTFNVNTKDDVAHNLGYSSGFVLSNVSTSGYFTTLPSTIDDHFNGSVVRVQNTTLRGQARVIRDYVGSTRFLQTEIGFTSALSSGTYLLIYPIGGQLGNP